MKVIKLSRGKECIVSDSNYEELNKYKWSYTIRNGNEYAVTSVKINGVYKGVKMHRMIMGETDPKIFIDHIDGNGLNNQLENLRRCTHAENVRNRRPNKNSTSKYLGVSWKSAKRRWYVGIRHDGRHVYIGTYKDEKEAAVAYNLAAVKYFGEFAKPNQI